MQDKSENPLSSAYTNNTDLLITACTSFQRNGYAKFPSFLTNAVLMRMVDEAVGIQPLMVRRDFIMPEYKTERSLSVVGKSLVSIYCPSILNLYGNPYITDFMEKIAGESVHQIDHPEESIVLNLLSENMDTHGWHLDDPKFALVIVLDIQGEGGHVELIPDWKSLTLRHDCSMLSFLEKIDRNTVGTRIDKISLNTGDAYMLNAANTLHRVSPLKFGRRMVVNFAYHNKLSISYGDTATRLYARS